jgi:hypothetical protein
LESHGGQTVGRKKDDASALKKCNGNLQDGTKIGQRIGSLKGRQVRTVVDNKGMLVFHGIGEDDREDPHVMSAEGE